MRYLLNLIYLPVLLVLLICAIHPRYRYQDVLGGFWNKFLGLVPQFVSDRQIVWFHAVSVGETILCGPVIRRLQQLHPEIRFVLSVSSPEGLAVGKQEFPDLDLFYAPYDFTWSVNRSFRRINPSLLVIAENDLWPNLIGEAGRRRIPCAIFNTRMSPREQQEHSWNGWLISPSLKGVRWWGVVDQNAADWIQKLFGTGSPPVEVTGLVKFNGDLPDRTSAVSREIRSRLGFSEDEQILLAGSTHQPEEEMILKVYHRLRQNFPKLRLILVPRYINRSPEIRSISKDLGIPLFTLTENPSMGDNPDSVLLVDSVGQLRDLWGIADLGFVGGSMVAVGGQNMAEPASCGVPVCFGPHVFNFQSLADDLVENGGACIIQSSQEVEDVFATWLQSPETAVQAGSAARTILDRHRQPLEITIQRLSSLIPNSQS